MNIGIDALGIATSCYALDLATLAEARGIDPLKYTQGLGQQQMSVAPPDEDIVTMAASAADAILSPEDKASIELVLFATESGIDQSKAAGIWVQHLIGLPKRCRIIELKQACYSATCALQMARYFVTAHPNKKALILASDIARYGLNTPGEPTQGCGAAAVLVSANPRLIALDPEYGLYADHVMDFWRPNYRDEALVDGHYSTRVYLSSLGHAWDHYVESSGRTFADHATFCYHLPFTRMAEKAHERLARHTKQQIPSEELLAQIEPSLSYARRIGNSYSASLYVGIASLLENGTIDLGGKRLGLFSYGSGCVAEFFSGVVQPTYQQALHSSRHNSMLNLRQKLNYHEYAELYQFQLPQDGSEAATPQHATSPFRLTGVKNHVRLYERLSESY